MDRGERRRRKGSLDPPPVPLAQNQLAFWQVCSAQGIKGECAAGTMRCNSVALLPMIGATNISDRGTSGNKRKLINGFSE